jgi:TonB family protein
MDRLNHDIERYLKGELSPKEMHALEKRALNDPFLADALEGLEDVSKDSFEQDLAYLRAQLPNAETKKKNIWLWSARIAASIAFLVIIGLAVFFVSNKEKESDHLALNDKKETGVPPTLDEIIPEANDSLTAVEAQPRKPISPPQEVKPDKSEKPPAPGTDAQRQQSEEASPLPETEFLEPIGGIALDSVAPTLSGREEAGASEFPGQADRDKAVAPGLRRIHGIVRDGGDGKGLPGVNVTIKGTNIGTITDEMGQYEIPVDSLKAGLVFSFIGFESTEVVPGRTNNVDVTLNPDISQLSEVVVVGYGSTKQESLPEYPVVEMAAPEGGRKAFKEYLEKNLRYPEQALNNKVEGKVTVQFTIEPSGKISDFRVLKSLGYGCDEEVVRLIKQGPKWVPTKKNSEAVKDKVRVRMRFSLPKKK